MIRLRRSTRRPPLATLLAAFVFTVPVWFAVPAVLEAQERVEPDRSAVEAARTLSERGTRPDAIASEMASRYRQSPAQTAAILRGLRVRVDATAGAVIGSYRLRSDAVASALVAGGFEAGEVVSGTARLGVATGELARGFRDAGLPTREVARAFRAGGRPEEDAATGLRAVDVPIREAAALVKDQYGTMEASRMRFALVRGGYTYAPPSITRYWIADYRRGGSNQRIENYGVVDPARVPGAGLPTDGRVTIEGDGLDAPGTTVTVEHDGGVTEGEVRPAPGGGLEVELAGFGSGELVVETPGGRTSMPVLALSWVERDAQQLFGPGPSFTFGGSVAQVAWGFRPGEAVTPDFSSSGNLDVIVTGGTSVPEIVLASDGGHDLSVEATFNVPTTVSGSFTPTVTCWTCGSFQIEKALCPTLTGDCILANLEAALGSLFECANPDNWSQEQIPGPSVPIHAQGISIVTYKAYVDMHPNGQIQSAGSGDNEALLWNAFAVPVPDQPWFQTAEIWWDNEVVPALLEPGTGFAEAVADRLGAWPQYLSMGPGAELAGIHAQPGNTVRLSFRH